MTFAKGGRVRLPDGRYGTVTYLFEQHPFAGDVSIKVDGRRERELWAAEDLIRITEPDTEPDTEPATEPDTDERSEA